MSETLSSTTQGPGTLPASTDADERVTDRVLAKQQRLQDVFTAALNNRLTGNPDSPATKFIEKLSPAHFEVLMLKAMGFMNIAIAERTGYTKEHVSKIVTLPDAKVVIAAMVANAADDILDVPTRIKAVQGEMLDAVIDVVRTTGDQKLKAQSAFELLKMGGHGAIQKTEVKSTVVVEEKAALGLTTALQEAMAVSRELPSTGRFVVSAASAVPDEPEQPENAVEDAPPPAMTIQRVA